jgi:hypothetical protein
LKLRFQALQRLVSRGAAHMRAVVLSDLPVIEPAPQAPLLKPVESEHAADDRAADDQQAHLQIAHDELCRV